MVRVCFTPNLQRHVACPPCEVRADTVAQALERAFADNARARGYVLDERGQLRAHMVVFVDGAPIHDRAGLSDALGPDAEVFVMQALSGG